MGVSLFFFSIEFYLDKVIFRGVLGWVLSSTLLPLHPVLGLVSYGSQAFWRGGNSGGLQSSANHG